jgi:RNA polymerase sigma-70 factor (ECF subfamily)
MNREEFEIEARRIRPHLYNEACRYLQNAEEAEDVTQDALLKLWSMRHELDKYRSVEALSVVVVHHLCFDLMRTNDFRLRGEEPLKDELGEKVDSPEKALIDHEDYTRLMAIIDTLPDAQQATLRMKHIDGLDVPEIARIIGTEEVTVRVNLSRARRQIMKLFFNQ